MRLLREVVGLANNEEMLRSQEPNKIIFSDEEKLEYLSYMHRQLIKLLSLIEGERNGGDSAATFFGGFLFDINSADMLFGNRLAPVLVKLNGLYADFAYRGIEYKVVRNKIFESRGIVEGLMKEIGGPNAVPKRRSKR